MLDHALTTSNLSLRPAIGSDLEELLALWTNPEVRKHLWDDAIIPRETVEEVVNASIESFKTNGFGQWAVRERDDDAIVGFCGLRFIEGTSVVEILYGFLPAKWGKGYATEAAKAVLQHGFKAAGLDEIVAEMDPPNRASIRVAEKLGMEFVTEYYREGLPTLRYSLSKSVC